MSSENDKLFDLKALEAFRAAMAQGSMTGAARKLGVGQPNVTRLIKDLETACGFQLFHRNGPRITPTDRGLRFYEEVDRLVAGMRQIRDRAEAIRTDQVPALDIAATPTMAGGLLPLALAGMPPPLPQRLNVQTMGAEHVARALRSRSADLGVSAFPLDHAGLTRLVVARADVVVAVADDDPLARAEVIALAELAERRLITVGNAYRLRRGIDEALQAQNIAPCGEFATNSSLNAVMAARAGLGLGLVDPVTAYGIPVAGVTIRTLDTRIPYAWGLFSDSQRLLSPPLTDFIASFRDACIRTIPQCQCLDPDDPEALRMTGGSKKVSDR